ncbi:MAG: hypothetical protein AABX14_00115 [Candidatus Aenigmatarchaeota archaeon]
MNAIVNGIGIGFLSAIFISIYVEGFFQQIFPVWLIYGIFAPLVSAIAITIFTLKGKNKDENLQWYTTKEE